MCVLVGLVVGGVLIRILTTYFKRDFDRYYHDSGTSIPHYSSIDANVKAMDRNRYY